MRPRFFIPLAVVADVLAVSAWQVIDPGVIDPVFNLLAELPIVGLMIWMFLKIDERHRDTLNKQRDFYARLLSDMMHFAKDIRDDDK